MRSSTSGASRGWSGARLTTPRVSATEFLNALANHKETEIFEKLESGFAAETHDFESRYLDGLIGPLPECGTLYAARAPAGHWAW